MEANFKTFKKLTIECKLDSSEAIMFSEGGKHTVNLSDEELTHLRDEWWNEIEISVQIEGGMLGRTKWIKQEAFNHRQRCDSEN